MILPQPAIELLGIQISEPVTTLTDLIVSGVCFYAFIKLESLHTGTNKVHFFLRYYFLSMGIATAIGGIIGHGFYYLFVHDGFKVSPWKLPGWLTSMLSIALVERASIEYARKIVKPVVGKIFAWINVIELLTFMTLTFSHLDFFFVEVHSAYGLLIVVSSFNAYVYYKTRSRGSKIFLYAVGFSAISALFFMNQWSLHTWFNYLDISHCFMAISAYTFYLGARAEIQNPLH